MSRIRRHQRIRAKLKGTATRPRLAVFRSGKYLYAQIIDDTARKTLVAVRDVESKKTKGKAGEDKAGKRPTDVGFTKVARAFSAGERLAKAAMAKKVKQVAFDRGGYAYQGRVKALAEGARAGGLEF